MVASMGPLSYVAVTLQWISKTHSRNVDQLTKSGYGNVHKYGLTYSGA